jgi:hypothetical protein
MADDWKKWLEDEVQRVSNSAFQCLMSGCAAHVYLYYAPSTASAYGKLTTGTDDYEPDGMTLATNEPIANRAMTCGQIENRVRETVRRLPILKP